jgi:hypothetical protein
MIPQLAQELRITMEQFTEHVVMPPGLARSAYLRWRRRRVMTRAAVAAAAAVVAGAAVVITASGDGGNAQAQGAAYVVTHVENALTAVGRGNNISFSRTTSAGLSSDAPAAGFPWRTDLAWNTRDRFNEIEYTSSGRTFFSLTVTRVPGGLQMLTVQYAYRLVIHQELTGAGTARGCSTAAGVLATLDFNPNDLTNWPATIRALVGCKLLRLAGHQRVGGVDLIRFVQPQVPVDYLSVALLVNPSTFLPSRMVVTWSQPGQGWQTTTEFGSLPPTRANLAHLSAPIPAGFTQSYQRPEAAGSSAYGNETSWMSGQ